MAVQVTKGKGFEYACLQGLYEYLSTVQEVNIVKTEAYITAQNAFSNLSVDDQQNMGMAARAAVKVITRLEPQLENSLGNTPLELSIQTDARGQAGDVRDVVAVRRKNEWEIGISSKNNHSAVKHSRLSQTIDFGERWLGKPASKEYFDKIRPIFAELESLKQAGIEWKALEDKESKFYTPVLEAFMEELKQLDSTNPGIIPGKLLSYLLGKHDFYKVIACHSDKKTQIYGFSMYGTLNRPAGKIQPQTKMPRLKLPNEFYKIHLKPGSNNTVLIVCNEGWQISARIHNASTKVEPSLKFDIQLVGNPPNLYTHHESWWLEESNKKIVYDLNVQSDCKVAESNE